MHAVTIAGRPIGPDEPTYLVAEAGVNHNGDLAIAVRMIEVAREVTGHDIPASPAPRREGDPPELYADPTKAMTELGWQAKYTDIRRIIETAWNWHRAHPHGYAAK